MDHIDFYTEHCLFAPPDSSSSDQMVMAMSIPTQRRLIRKPLPDLPANQADKVGCHSMILGRSGSPRQHAITLEESRQRAKRVALKEQKQLDWWPLKVREKQAAIKVEENEAGPSNLSEYYKRHLFRIIESSLDASGRPSRALATTIFKALEECLDTLATLEALHSLHQSYSFLWRVEAMVLSNEQLDYSKMAKTAARWPRLGGWRGSLSANLNGIDTSARRKKRDIALQLLGGAFWLNGSSTTLGGSDTFDEIVAEIQTEKTTKRKSQGSAPQLLVKTSLPTVALQTDNGSEELKSKVSEEKAEERTSILTSRLAMQLRNSEKNSEVNPGTINRRKSAQNEEEKIMAVCKVCLDYIDDLEEREGTLFRNRRRRSGTVTLPSSRREQNTSTLSDDTIRGIEELQGNGIVQITWKANQFTGSSLFLNPLSSEAEGRDQLRTSKVNSEIKFVGGTFLIESDRDDPEEKSIIRNVLDIGLYSASAMMLESALLRNFQLEEQVEQNQPEETVKDSEERNHQEKIDSIPMSKISTLDGDVDKQSRWPTSIWGIMQYTTADQAIKKDVPTSAKSRLNLKKPSKKASGYSGRFGKLIGSFTGSTTKRTTSADYREEAPEVVQETISDQVEQNEQVEVPKSPLPEEREEYSPPVAISPYYSDQAATERSEYEKDDYMEHLLSQQSLHLTVLEGMDLSLSIGKQQDEASVQRIPLLSRKSFNDTESRVNGLTTSAHSSSKSARSSNSNLQVDQQAPAKQQPTLPTSIESNLGWDEKNQREVQFYQRAGASRDVSLGQAVEEMAAKAAILDKQAKELTEGKDSKKAKDSKESKASKESQEDEGPSFRAYRVAQYLHNHDRITVMASVRGNSSCLLSSDFVPIQFEAPPSTGGVQDCETKSKEEEHPIIQLWTADINTGEESTVTTMSEATYLTSYGGFIQAILSHPKFVQEKHSLVQMFQVGDILIKFQIQHIVVFDLLVEGPVVVLHQKEEKFNLGNESYNDKPKNKQSQDEKLLERTRLEIQSFYSSVKRHISSLEHVLVARELDNKGKTIKLAFLSRQSSIMSEDSKNNDGTTQVDSVDDDSLPSSRALNLLSKLKKSIRRVEFDLYEGLKSTKASCINDVRIQFQHRARSAKKRLSAWEVKHLTKEEIEHLEPLDYLEPEYFEANNYVFPGSRHLVREDEPLSMIAYTLSSRDFDGEIHRIEQRNFDVLNWRNSVMVPSTQSQMTTSSNASTNTVTTSNKVTNESQATLDPDKDEDFYQPEPLQVRTKRKKRVKDAGILSIRLKRATSDISSVSEKESADTESKKESNHQASASLDESTLTTTPTVSRIASSSFSKFDTVSSSNADTFRAQVAHVAPRGSLGSMFEGGSSAPPTPSEERSELFLQGHTTREASDVTTSTPTQSTFQRRTFSQPIDNPRINMKTLPLSPHIKHIIVSGNLKMSCVSWFAEDFAKLRQKWKIDDEFINSMTRCKNWSTMGGKSKSGFYVTLDGKWIAKQLLNVWSVDEKEAFLEFAPAYLRYMKDSVVNDNPTLLVKIAGVYTLKFKNVKTGEVKLKMSVQVLENVFAEDQGESIRFDIKGIRDRRVQAKKENTGQEDEERAQVWWDGEWLDTFQSRAYVPQSHKALFRSALHNDLAFLKASNVMDYSLLIGAHESGIKGREEEANKNRTRSLFNVRIIDFLGAFTLAKYIESSSKKAIQSQAPTIIPPNEYAARFAKAVETYFIPCPS